MTTLKQVAANRRNALLSTGPRTDEGKARSSRNALQHGLAARNVIDLDHEDEAEYKDLRDSLLDHLQPADPHEELLASNIISAAWSLRRVQRLEPALFSTYLRDSEYAVRVRDLPNGEMAYAFRATSQTFQLFARYRAMAERAFYKAHQELENYRTNPIPDPDTSVPTPDTPDPTPAPNSPTSNGLPSGPDLASSP